MSINDQKYFSILRPIIIRKYGCQAGAREYYGLSLSLIVLLTDQTDTEIPTITLTGVTPISSGEDYENI